MIERLARSVCEGRSTEGSADREYRDSWEKNSAVKEQIGARNRDSKPRLEIPSTLTEHASARNFHAAPLP